MPGHDVGSSDIWGTNRGSAGPWLRSRLSRPNRSLPRQARNGEGRAIAHPAPATEQAQTKLYGFVVNSWSDKVLSVQRIWTRTRTR